VAADQPSRRRVSDDWRRRRARRLRRDLGLSADAVVIIVRLLDRIEVLEGRRRARPRARILDE
jgi:hypothetical protein